MKFNLAVFLFAIISMTVCNAFQMHTSRLSVKSSELNMQGSHGFVRLGRAADARKALLRSLTTEVIRHGRIRTTLVKAKALRKRVDHMITLAKSGTQHSRYLQLSIYGPFYTQN